MVDLIKLGKGALERFTTPDAIEQAVEKCFAMAAKQDPNLGSKVFLHKHKIDQETGLVDIPLPDNEFYAKCVAFCSGTECATRLFTKEMASINFSSSKQTETMTVKVPVSEEKSPLVEAAKALAVGFTWPVSVPAMLASSCGEPIPASVTLKEIEMEFDVEIPFDTATTDADDATEDAADNTTDKISNPDATNLDTDNDADQVSDPLDLLDAETTEDVADTKDTKEDTQPDSVLEETVPAVIFDPAEFSPSELSTECSFSSQNSSWKIFSVQQNDTVYNAVNGIPPSIFVNAPSAGTDTKVVLRDEANKLYVCNMDCDPITDDVASWTLACTDMPNIDSAVLFAAYNKIDGEDAVYLELQFIWKTLVSGNEFDCFSTSSVVYVKE